MPLFSFLAPVCTLMVFVLSSFLLLTSLDYIYAGLDFEIFYLSCGRVEALDLD